MQSMKEVIQHQFLGQSRGGEEAIGEHVDLAVGLIGNRSRESACSLQLDELPAWAFQLRGAPAQDSDSSRERGPRPRLGGEKLAQSRSLALVSAGDLRLERRGPFGAGGGSVPPPP